MGLFPLSSYCRVCPLTRSRPRLSLAACEAVFVALMNGLCWGWRAGTALLVKLLGATNERDLYKPGVKY